MVVEIGSLVVRGTFGKAARDDGQTREEMQAEMQRLRVELQREMRDLIDEAHRRSQER